MMTILIWTQNLAWKTTDCCNCCALAAGTDLGLIHDVSLLDKDTSSLGVAFVLIMLSYGLGMALTLGLEEYIGI